jgi:organic hydroperoxide reductase OsmC/OhrA
MREHRFKCRTRWTGAEKGSTESYESYSREYEVEVAGKPALRGSAAGAFRGDESLHNPEDLLVAALSGCHMLTYLALAAREKLAVTAYEDNAEGTMAIKDRRLRFTELVLRPRVTVARGSDLALARKLHGGAHDQCFIANSVNFPVRHEAEIVEA